MKNRIFHSDGKSFILAIDHPLTMPSPDLSDVASVIIKAIDGGVDAFLASYGCIRHFSRQNMFADKGLVLRADGGSVIMGKPSGKLELLYNAEDAARVGADALMCMGYPGSMENASTLANVAALSRQAHKCELMCGAEMLPYGFEKHDGIDTRSIENVAFACRLGAELGADFIKTEFVGGYKFSEVVHNCYVPVLVLGGSKAKTEEEILGEVKDAMEAGASGVIMGRNVVRSNSMVSLCRAIGAIIHYDVSLEQAYDILNRKRY